MLPWLLTRWDAAVPHSPFEIWLVLVLVFDALSLVLNRLVRQDAVGRV